MEALCAHFLGTASGSWSDNATKLEKYKLINKECVELIRKVDNFGRFIGNNDRHLGNFSFLSELYLPSQCAPVYDMLPMHFMPKNNYFSDQIFEEPLLQNADEKAAWLWAYPIALEYWSALAKGEIEISKSFIEIATKVKNSLLRMERLIERF